MNIFKNNRFDYFLIWGNGLKYREKIIDIIADYKNLSLLKIINFKPRSIKKFVRRVYSYDYAPLEHLEAKTKYLLKTSPEVFVIFVLNTDPDERWFGEGSFRHVECMRIKRLKEDLRNKFNPTVNGKRTEEHVVHGSDNEIQTENMLKILGFRQGLKIFRTNNNSYLDIPYYLSKFRKFTIKQVPVSKLYCNVLSGNVEEFSLHQEPISSSPHYLSLKKGNIKLYSDYISSFLGGPLGSYYSVKKFELLKRNLVYPNGTSYILVEMIKSGKYLILDGVHRASILMFRNQLEVPVALVEHEE